MRCGRFGLRSRCATALGAQRGARARLGREARVRTGVNTGEVVAGDAGGGQRFATGDAVNVAKRLEEAAPPGEILLGEPTYRLVRDAVEVAEVEPLGLKGKAAPVAAYRLLSLEGAVPGHARRLDSPMVGRERELAALEQAYRAGSRASGRAICSRCSAPLGSASRGSSPSSWAASATRPRSCAAVAFRTARASRTGP